MARKDLDEYLEAAGANTRGVPADGSRATREFCQAQKEAAMKFAKTITHENDLLRDRVSELDAELRVAISDKARMVDEIAQLRAEIRANRVRDEAGKLELGERDTIRMIEAATA